MGNYNVKEKSAQQAAWVVHLYTKEKRKISECAYGPLIGAKKRIEHAVCIDMCAI